MNIKIKVIENGKIPVFKRKGDACCDCYARLSDNLDSISIPPNSRCLVNLGFALELPEEYEAIIRPRSGLSSRYIDICIGTIDSNYRGEVKACIVNNSNGYFDVRSGDRICQLAIRKTEDIVFEQVENLSETNRGDNGFGSSGI